MKFQVPLIEFGNKHVILVEEKNSLFVVNHKIPMNTSGKRAFGQASLVPAVIWAGTKSLATSPQIRLRVRHPLVPIRYNPLVPI
jgi:hypothetical protein